MMYIGINYTNYEYKVIVFYAQYKLISTYHNYLESLIQKQGQTVLHKSEAIDK